MVTYWREAQPNSLRASLSTSLSPSCTSSSWACAASYASSTPSLGTTLPVSLAALRSKAPAKRARMGRRSGRTCPGVTSCLRRAEDRVSRTGSKHWAAASSASMPSIADMNSPSLLRAASSYRMTLEASRPELPLPAACSLASARSRSGAPRILARAAMAHSSASPRSSATASWRARIAATERRGWQSHCRSMRLPGPETQWSSWWRRDPAVPPSEFSTTSRFSRAAASRSTEPSSSIACCPSGTGIVHPVRLSTRMRPSGSSCLSSIAPRR
mmetsp:Transcript_64102/g.202799  ORF Transcript_64102/g.202799 Transcript_64102/m.202799 type:complete len:272 (-) Transcript_64102:1059-1874(-)